MQHVLARRFFCTAPSKMHRIKIICNRCMFAVEHHQCLHVRDADGDSRQIMSTTITASADRQIVVYLEFFCTNVSLCCSHSIYLLDPNHQSN